MYRKLKVESVITVVSELMYEIISRAIHELPLLMISTTKILPQSQLD